MYQPSDPLMLHSAVNCVRSRQCFMTGGIDTLLQAGIVKLPLADCSGLFFNEVLTKTGEECAEMWKSREKERGVRGRYRGRGTWAASVRVAANFWRTQTNSCMDGNRWCLIDNS